MSVQQAQHVQAQAAAMNALGLLDPSALFGNLRYSKKVKSFYQKINSFCFFLYVVSVANRTGSLFFPLWEK